ncbi:hypothetical protein J3E69DRAFT_344379 [Trichoderma sp. SZMC 28015]
MSICSTQKMPTFISKNLRPRSAASPARLSVTIRRSEHSARSLQVARKLGFRQCKTHAEDIKIMLSPGFRGGKKRRGREKWCHDMFFDKMQHDIGQHMIKMRCNNFRPSAAEILLNCYHTASHFQTSASPPHAVCVAWLSRNGVPQQLFRPVLRKMGNRAEKSSKPPPREPYLSDRPGRARSKRANSTMPYSHVCLMLLVPSPRYEQTEQVPVNSTARAMCWCHEVPSNDVDDTFSTAYQLIILSRWDKGGQPFGSAPITYCSARPRTRRHMSMLWMDPWIRWLLIIHVLVECRAWCCVVCTCCLVDLP